MNPDNPNNNPHPENEQPSINPAEAGIVILCSYFFSVIPELLVISMFPGDPSSGQFDPLGIKFAFVIGEASLIIFPIIYLRMRELSLPTMFRWQPVPRNILGMSAAIGLGLTVLIDELDRLIRLFAPMPEEWVSSMETAFRATDMLEMFLLILGVIILAALVEESIFRGFLQGILEEGIDVTKAVIYTSLIWAFIHLNPYQSVQTFLFGFMLGYLTWRTGSILPAILCHAISNSIALIYYNSDFNELLPFYEWNGHVSPFLLVLAGLVVYSGVRYITEYYIQLNSFSSSASSEK